MKFARYCINCNSIYGCKHPIKDCDTCNKWNNCWIDLIKYEEVVETSGFCPPCLAKILKRNRERRKK